MKYLLILFIALVSVVNLQAQVFETTNGTSDYFIDLNWSIPPNPCLFNDLNQGRYNSGITIQLLKDNQQIDYTSYSGNELFAFYGPQEPDLAFVYKSNGDAIYVENIFNVDPFIGAMTDYTVEMWFKADNGSEDLLRIVPFTKVRMENNNKFYIDDLFIDYDFVPNAWHHLAIVADQSSGTSEIVINGIAAGTINKFHPAKKIANIGDFNKQDFRLGEFRLWDVKRTVFQIKSDLEGVSPSSPNLVTLYKCDNSGITFLDRASSYDGIVQPIAFNNAFGNHTLTNFAYFPPYKPIEGILTDFVGPDETHNYELKILNVFGSPTLHCSSNTSVGSTSPVQSPQDISVTTDLLDRVKITWKNKSDLATSFKLYRDTTLIKTIVNDIGKDSVFTYDDVFNANNPIGIKSGKPYAYSIKMASSHVNQTWTYPLGTGKTLDANFIVSKNFNNRAEMTWSTIANTLVDQYKIKRNNKNYTTRQKTNNSFIDLKPLFGDSISYDLILVKKDTVRAVFSKKGFVIPNGVINGRVLTEGDLFPVEGVQVKIQREKNGHIDSTMTNEFGVFSFNGIAYGLLDSFEFSAAKLGHSFTYPIPKVGIHANQPLFENAVILDSVTYASGNAMIDINFFNVAAVSNQDHVTMEWDFTTASDTVLIDILRNGEVIYNQNVITPEMNLISTMYHTDLDGRPNEASKYELRIYNITGNQVSIAKQDTTLAFPKVSRIPDGDFFVSAHTTTFATGNVALNWIPFSNNIDAYRIYRQDSLLAELPISSTSYIDTEAPFDSNLVYTITSIRTLDNLTFETENPTASIPAIVNLGSMPAPTNVQAIPFPFSTSLQVNWVAPGEINAATNYTGYIIYRDSTEIGRVHKSQLNLFDDYFGLGGQYVYSVSTYRTIEEGIIESERISSPLTTFPNISQTPTNLQYVVDLTNGINLTWDNNGNGYYTGLLLQRNGMTVARLDRRETSYTDYPNTEGTFNYRLYRYIEQNGVEYLSNYANVTTIGIPPYNQPVLAPQNFMASRDLPNHVKLCWEYLDFVQSTFEIYKNNVLIATLPIGSRSYYDYTADSLDHSIKYTIRAKNLGQFSDIIGATGDVIDHKLVFGTVIDTNTGLGVKGARIIVNYDLIAVTNEAGYYSFLVSNENALDPPLNMRAYFRLNSFVDQSIQIGEADHYQVDFESALSDPFPYSSPAVITYLDVDMDVYDLRGHVHWQASNGNYDGVEVRRGMDIIATVAKQDGNMVIDSTAVPGIEYIYQIRTYTDMPERGKVFTPYDDNYITKIEYPALAPVINLTATPLSDANSVQIQWSHLYDHADGYEIKRNGVFIKTVLTDNPFTFTDTMGVAAEQYTYTLRAYKIIENNIYFSSEESVTVTYPDAAKVKNFTLAAPFLYNTVRLIQSSSTKKQLYYLNHVLLTWEYDGVHLEGFKIYRDDELIAQLPADSLSYKDYEGIPESSPTYSIEAIVVQDGKTNISGKAVNGITFPKVEQPFEIGPTPRPTIGDVEFSWKYMSPGIDGFKITYGSPQNIIYLNKDIITSDSIFSTFIDITSDPFYSSYFNIRAYAIRNGIEYLSSPTSTSGYNYPEPPVVSCAATNGTYDNAVEITWVYPRNANVDGFTITRVHTENGGSITETIANLSKGERKYVDDFSAINTQFHYFYTVAPTRILYGNSVAYPATADEGWPGKADVDNLTSFGTSEDMNSIATDQDWMVVGKAGQSIGGAVYIYQYVDNEWIEKQVISSTDPDDIDASFGASVAIDGDLIVIGAPGRTSNKGAAYTYRLNASGLWVHEAFIDGTIVSQAFSFGSAVAIDNNTFAVSSITLGVAQLQQDTYQKMLKVYSIPSGCQSFGCYDQLPVQNVYRPWMEIDNSYVVPLVFGQNIDIYGADIVLGGQGSYYENSVINRNDGLVAHYRIQSGQVSVDTILLDDGNISNENFGEQVSMDNGKLVVSAPLGSSPNGVSGGKALLYRYQSQEWQEFQSIYPATPTNGGKFGNAVKLENGMLAIGEPVKPNNGSRIHLYKENLSTTYYELEQSPDSGSATYREEFLDTGSPDKYNPNFGEILDISEHHIAVGSNTDSYVFDLFPVELEDFLASDGTFVDTKLTWSIGDCQGCPSDYIDSIRVYRDSELIARVSGNSTSFFDNFGNLLPGISEAISGKEYIYEIEAKIKADFDYTSIKYSNVGYSKRKGKMSGEVLVIGTSSPVPGAVIHLTGVDTTDNVSYAYSGTTLSDGTYLIENIYVGEGISYKAEPVYEDHSFLAVNGDTYLFTPSNFDKPSVFFLDETAYVVTGSVRRQGSLCDLEGIKVDYFQSINGLETFVDSVKTDKNGVYSMVIKPNISNLTAIKIKVDNNQESLVAGDTSTVQYLFSPQEKVFTNFINFDIVHEQDFVDTLTYPIQLRVENTCGSPIADQPITIRIGDLDGCYESEVTTDEYGVAQLNLPPKNYILSVSGIEGSGVTNYENAGVNFLKARPVILNLLDQHIEADSDTLPTIDPVRFVYHKAVSFAYTTSFERFFCQPAVDPPAIIKQGEDHTIDFVLSENHRPGENCSVNEGYIIIRNGGSVIDLDTIYPKFGVFETYKFTAGSPNLVAPYIHGISVQYFSEQGSLLGEKLLSVIVEGQRSLPGTGVVTDALTDEAGDLQMPLLVLRDPPGDGSYSRIETGASISKSLNFKAEDSGSFGFNGEAQAAIGGFGVFGKLDIGVGASSATESSIDFTVNTTQAYQTSSADNGIGREANIIVGAGVSSLYGLSQILKINENCIAEKVTKTTFGISGFNTTYGYTIAFIENLIKEYKADSIANEVGLLDIERADGSLFDKDEAKEYLISKINSWEEMIHYHDVETVPHYVLCNDFSYRDGISPNAIAVYDQWRNGFCNMIGQYNGETFVMDESITWTPALIAAYNNTVAFTDEIKGYYLNEIDSGDLGLDNKEITANNLSVTNQYHNTLGNAAKSAEVFDFSGGVSFDRSISTQQSSSTSKSFSRFFYSDAAIGGLGKFQTEVGFFYSQKLVDVEIKAGVRIQLNASISVSKAQAESNDVNVSYHIYDDDPEDQVAFIALQAPLQDQTPFFIRLGGLSSCPQEEALTVNQDNDPLLIDNPEISVIIDPSLDPVTAPTITNPGPVYNVPIGSAAIFSVKMSQTNGPTNLTRDAVVRLDLASNPNGAIIKLGGSNLNIVSPTFSLPSTGAIVQSLTVERPAGTPFYSFENLRIGIRPACGGAEKFITLSVYFDSPCSEVSLSQPFDGQVIKRKTEQNPREEVRIEIRDYQSSNPNLTNIQLQFKRLGSGQDWKPIPEGYINRATLAMEDASQQLGEDKQYLFTWNITGLYNLYPDGDYKIRALAFCGVNGTEYSNEATITLARSPLLVIGSPEPADGIWTSGDIISSTYSTDIDCGIYNSTDSIQKYLKLINLSDMTSVPFNHVCKNNKLTLVPINPMSNYDGDMLRASYTEITNIIGNLAQDVIWNFEVVTEKVYWKEKEVNITIFEGETKSISTSILNTTTSSVNNLNLTGGLPWITSNPAFITESFNVPVNGKEVQFTVDGSQLTAGSYEAILSVVGAPLTVRNPSIKVKVKVVKPVPTYPIDPNFTDSMTVIANWSFLNPYTTSTDVNDVIQVYKNGQFRGSGKIKNLGTFYYASIKVFGNASDIGEDLDFVIWNSDEAVAYEPVYNATYLPIKFQGGPGAGSGTLSDPSILLVDNDIYTFRNIIYVDSTNINGIKDGLSWATAFNKLEDGISVANASDEIWMAKGTYYPSSGDRNASYVVNKAISIHGGFQYGMTDLNQRTGTDPTTLSGNIGIKAASTDNSYHVVETSGTGIILDQLTIRDGTADGLGNDGSGSGLYNIGSVRLSNCIMSYGAATTNGTLIYNAGDIIIQGGNYYIPAVSAISNLYNASGATFTIEEDVSILEE